MTLTELRLIHSIIAGNNYLFCDIKGSECDNCKAVRILRRELELKEIEKNPTGAVMTGCIRCHKIYQEYLVNCPYCNYPAQEKNAT